MLLSNAGIAAAHHQTLILFILITLHLLKHVCACIRGTCGGQRTTYGSQLSPSTLCVLGMDRGTSGLTASAFTRQAISPAPSYFWRGNLTQILMLAKQTLYQRTFLPPPVVNSRTVTTEGSQGQSQPPIPSQLQTWTVRFLGLLENEQWLPPLRKFSHVSQECWEHSPETQTNARVEN